MTDRVDIDGMSAEEQIRLRVRLLPPETSGSKLGSLLWGLVCSGRVPRPVAEDKRYWGNLPLEEQIRLWPLAKRFGELNRQVMKTKKGDQKRSEIVREALTLFGPDKLPLASFAFPFGCMDISDEDE